MRIRRSPSGFRFLANARCAQSAMRCSSVMSPSPQKMQWSSSRRTGCHHTDDSRRARRVSAYRLRQMPRVSGATRSGLAWPSVRIGRASACERWVVGGARRWLSRAAQSSGPDSSDVLADASVTMARAQRTRVPAVSLVGCLKFTDHRHELFTRSSPGIRRWRHLSFGFVARTLGCWLAISAGLDDEPVFSEFFARRRARPCRSWLWARLRPGRASPGPGVA